MNLKSPERAQLPVTVMDLQIPACCKALLPAQEVAQQQLYLGMPKCASVVKCLGFGRGFVTAIPWRSVLVEFTLGEYMANFWHH